ncbi:MAG TPA: EthD family reductase [Acidimicrobiales bacterium]|nr:EthD family reductase [Acidimicrobiales bacterium]
MPKLVALWTAPDDVAGFDADYTATHAELARALPGVDAEFNKAVAPGPYHRIAELRFESMDALQAALGSPEGAKVLGDAQRLQESFGNKLDVLIVDQG